MAIQEAQAPAATVGSRLPRELLSRINLPGVLVLVAMAIAWEIAASRLPSFLFPPLRSILDATLGLFGDPTVLGTIALTYARIVAAVVFSFLIAVSFGIAAGLNRTIARAAAPVLAIMQGVPGICWIIFAVLWFTNIEVRIAFIVVISTAPSFFFQARDAVLSISTDLREMVRAWRPTRSQVIRKLILPALTPVLLTTLLVNLGIATKVGVTAELLTGISGIGNALRNAQEQFRMDMAIAWTVPLVIFILATNWLTNLAQRKLLRWRPALEHKE